MIEFGWVRPTDDQFRHSLLSYHTRADWASSRSTTQGWINSDIVARIIILCPCYRSSVNHEAWMSEKIHHITNSFASELIFHKTYRPLVRITRSLKLFSIQINKWSEINKYRLHIRLFCWIWFPFTKLISCCCRIRRNFKYIIFESIYFSFIIYVQALWLTLILSKYLHVVNSECLMWRFWRGVSEHFK